LSGSAGKTGDDVVPVKPTALASYFTALPKLDGNNVLGRFGSTHGAALGQAFSASVKQRADGVIELNGTDFGMRAYFAGHFEVVGGNQTSLATAADGTMYLTSQGIRYHVVPALDDLAEVGKVVTGWQLTIDAAGNIAATNGKGSMMFGRPALAVTQTMQVGPVMQMSTAGDGKVVLIASTGLGQTISPAFVDSSQLIASAAALGWNAAYDSDSLVLTDPAGGHWHAVPDYFANTVQPSGTDLGKGFLKGNDGRLYFRFNVPGQAGLSQAFSIR
jgi:hypothetical protein